MSSVSRKYHVVFMAALMLAALLALAGCASQQSGSASASAESASASSEAATPKTDVAVGKESDTAKMLVVKNSTGKTITEVALGETGTDVEAFSVLAVDGGEWADGMTAAIYYEPTSYTNFDIQLKCGEEVYMLHNFNFEGAEDIAILMEGDVAYVTFERDGNAISSLEDEMAIHNEAVAAAEAAAAEAAAQQAETYYYEEPTYTEPAPAQTDDSCVDGGVVLR